MATEPDCADQADVAEQFDNIAQQEQAALLGMWVFLATEVLLFGGAFTSFAALRMRHVTEFAAAASHLDLLLGSINTAVLLTSGLTMTLAEQAANIKRRELMLAFLLATMCLGVVFLGIKGYEWHHEYTEHLMPVFQLPFEFPSEHPEIAELFFNFYFTLTGLHAIHMLIGLVMLAVMALRIFYWHKPQRLARQLRIMGLYWAFVDVVWIFVYTSLYLLRANQ